ncbi:MAG: hypothetical protein FWG64_13655 [Firmicutes bacterium]|nr:hypothetical protein [Bacillota bacterium]
MKTFKEELRDLNYWYMMKAEEFYEKYPTRASCIAFEGLCAGRPDPNCPHCMEEHENWQEYQRRAKALEEKYNILQPA